MQPHRQRGLPDVEVVAEVLHERLVHERILMQRLQPPLDLRSQALERQLIDEDHVEVQVVVAHDALIARALGQAQLGVGPGVQHRVPAVDLPADADPHCGVGIQQAPEDGVVDRRRQQQAGHLPTHGGEERDIALEERVLDAKEHILDVHRAELVGCKLHCDDVTALRQHQARGLRALVGLAHLERRLRVQQQLHGRAPRRLGVRVRCALQIVDRGQQRHGRLGRRAGEWVQSACDRADDHERAARDVRLTDRSDQPFEGLGSQWSAGPVDTHIFEDLFPVELVVADLDVAVAVDHGHAGLQELAEASDEHLLRVLLVERVEKVQQQRRKPAVGAVLLARGVRVHACDHVAELGSRRDCEHGEAGGSAASMTPAANGSWTTAAPKPSAATPPSSSCAISAR